VQFPGPAAVVAPADWTEQIIRVDAKENVRKQILRELQVCHDCNSPYIVTFYGAFQNEARDIVLCMEYMDCGYVGWPTFHRGTWI